MLLQFRRGRTVTHHKKRYPIFRSPSSSCSFSVSYNALRSTPVHVPLEGGVEHTEIPFWIELVKDVGDPGVTAQAWTVHNLKTKGVSVSWEDFFPVLSVLVENNQPWEILKSLVVEMGVEGERPLARVLTTLRCNRLLKIYCERQNRIEARFLFDDMEERNLTSYIYMLRLYRKRNCYKEAIMLLHGMKEDGVTPSADFYSEIIAMLSQNSDYKSAEDIVRDMNDKNLPMCRLTFSAVLCLYRKQKDKEKLRDFLRSQTMMVSSSLFSPRMSSSIIEAYSFLRDRNAAEFVFAQVERNGVSHLPATYCYMIQLYLKLKYNDRALSLFHTLKNLDKRASIHTAVLANRLFQSYVELLDFRRAEEVLSIIEYYEYPLRGSMMRNVLPYLSHGKDREADLILKRLNALVNKKKESLNGPHRNVDSNGEE